MKVLTNFIPGAHGGINRRVHELERYVNSSRNLEGHRLVAVGLGPPGSTVREERGHMLRVTLPGGEWHAWGPGESTPAPAALASPEAFLEWIEPSAGALCELMEREAVDVCLAQAAFFSAWTLLAAARRAGVPSCQLYCGSSQTEIGDPEVRMAYRPIEIAFARMPQRTWFNSRFARATTEHCLDLSFADAPVIYNGISDLWRGVSPWRSSRVALGWVGRQSWVKNLGVLRGLGELLPEDVKIHVLSDADPGACTGMRRPGMSWHGPLPPSRMADFYTQVSCVLSTSRCDFYPNVMVEALAAGRVPLVPATTGTAEILRAAGLKELVVDLDAPQEVCGRILESGAWAGAVYKLGRRMREQHSWPAVIEYYLAELSQLA